MSAHYGLTAEEDADLYDAYRFKADDCISVQEVAERAVVRAHRDGRASGIRYAIYEGGLWCGECDPLDPDDDCCVIPERVRNELEDVTS